MTLQKHNLEGLLSTVVKEGSSDLHITVGRHPTIRIDGSLIPLLKEAVTTPENAEELIFEMLSPEQKERFTRENELDFSYNFKDRVRFRVNVFRQRGYIGAALRLIPDQVKTFKELNLPPILEEFSKFQQGFFLAVGPTGHGKSTTLAAMIDYINRGRPDHIITIEDPVEYIFASDRAIIDQREVGTDTASFQRALKSVFREDVDVAMVGEMRDTETIAMAVTAAETGHLVLSTLHTNNAAQTIDRIIDSFPGTQQGQIRTQLAATLIGIISQRLLPKTGGGLIPAVEILIANSAVKNLIRENKIHEIDLIIETSSEKGMMSLNRSLSMLVRNGDVTAETAMLYSLNPGELKSLLR